MKIEIEINEETAALVWANRTWEGREKYTMAEIVKDLAEEEAAKYRNTFPKAVARVVALAKTEMRQASPVQDQTALVRELYGMAIELCRDRGWSKHSTIEKAHAFLSAPSAELTRAAATPPAS